MVVESVCDETGSAEMRLRLVLNLFESLESNSVRCIHWKSNIRIEDALSGRGDLDLLVHPEDQDTFERILGDLHLIRMRGQCWARYPHVSDWIGFDEITGSIVHVHVHYVMITGVKRVKDIVLPWADYVIRTSRKMESSGVHIPIVEVEYVVMLIRAWAKRPLSRRFLVNQRLPSHVEQELLWLAKQCDSSKESLINR